MSKELITAHDESVNSVFVSLSKGIVISVDEESLRVWDPVNGIEIYQTDIDEDTVIPELIKTCH